MFQSRPKLNQQIYEEAGDWLVRHRSGALRATEREAFDAWLRSSPEHIRAYLEISAVWEDIAAIDQSSCPPAAKLIEHATRDGPIALTPETAGSAGAKRISPEGRRGFTVAATSPTRRPLGHQFRLGAIAAACLLGILVGWWVRVPSYSTGVAEQRSIRLADGSTIELNARSKVRVRFLAHERKVDLVQGQALFHVAKDPLRPFIVRASGTFVRAVGTQFDVNKLNGSTVVTVVEGLVAVFGTPPSSRRDAASLGSEANQSREEVAAELIHGLRGNIQPIYVSSGEQLTVTAKQVAEETHVNAAAATAWTRHRFAFDAAPLSQAVEEFNRYNARQLVVADPRLNEIRINGLFSSTDPSLLLQFLRNQPEISIEEVGDEIRIHKK